LRNDDRIKYSGKVFFHRSYKNGLNRLLGSFNLKVEWVFLSSLSDFSPCYKEKSVYITMEIKKSGEFKKIKIHFVSS